MRLEDGIDAVVRDELRGRLMRGERHENDTLHRGGRMKAGRQSPPVVATVEDDALRRHAGDLECAGSDRTRRTWLHGGEAGEVVGIRRRVDVLWQNEQAFGEAHSQEG